MDTGEGKLWRRCHGDGKGTGKLSLPLAVVNEDDNEKLRQHYGHFFFLAPPGTRNLTPSDTTQW